MAGRHDDARRDRSWVPGEISRQSRDQVYPVAELRLRLALIPLLVGGNTIPVQSLFGTIFEC
jgi:hypothetical protein